MQDEYAPRAQCAWALAGLSAPVALTLAGLSWHWALLGAAAAAGFYYILYRMCDMPLTRAAMLAYGVTAGRIVLSLTFFWTAFAAGAAAAGSAAAYPEDGLQWIAPACVLLLAAIGGWRGTQALARAAGVLSLVLAVLYAALLLAAVQQVKLEWCRPWGGAQQAVKAFSALLAASAALYLPQTGRRRKRAGALCIAAAVVPAVCACITSGCLSAQVVQRTQAPFYAMSKSLSVLGVAERFEPVVSAALLMGFFCLTSLLTQSAAGIACAVCPRLPERWCAAGACAIAGAAALVAGRVPQAAQMLLAAIFWGILPALTLGIVAVKKVRNKSKKVLDK